LKKPASSVRFRFYKSKTEKTKLNRTEPNPNRKKPEPNQAKLKKPSQTEPKKTKPNRTETGRFEPVSVFLKKIWFDFFYLYKNQTEQKMITPKIYCLSCLLSPFRFFHLLTTFGNRFGKITYVAKVLTNYMLQERYVTFKIITFENRNTSKKLLTIK
jgi:hypothetical protein